MAFRLATEFQKDGSIAEKFTCDGADISPELTWTEPPLGTKALALIADDPDAPGGTFVHWVLYDLPPDTRNLAEGLPKDRRLGNGARQGRNDFGKIGYNGPCPPKGSSHRYHFKLYALDAKINLKAGASKGDLEHAMKGHILGQTELSGRYSR